MSRDIQEGQVYLSRDHRNQSCPYLRVEGFSVGEKLKVRGVEFVLCQRFEDRELTKPRGQPVPVRRTAMEYPTYKLLE